MTFDFRLRVYPNPVRDDGVFVAEDKPIEPYIMPGPDGRLQFPAVPQTPFLIRSQLEPEFAAELVRRWNAQQEKSK